MCTWRLQVFTTFATREVQFQLSGRLAQTFERFRKASGLNLKEEEMQVNTLLYSLGDATDDVLCSFNLAEEDAKNYMIMV